MMALFPAFAELSNKVEDSPKELDWLNNKSFQTGDALSLHNRFLDETCEKREASADRDVASSEEEKREHEMVQRKKKKKSEKKKKKKKKHKKKSGRYSSSSGSDSDTIYPSDLKVEQEVKQQSLPIASCFSWLDDFKSTIELPFCVERKPDPSNWTYKSLYRGDVARYKRKGNSTLGLDSHRQGVSWEDSEAKKKRKAGDSNKSSERYFSAASRQLLRSENPVVIHPANPDGNNTSGSALFLPLGEDDENKAERVLNSGERHQGSSVNPLGVYDSSTALWMQGKGQQADQKPNTETEEASARVVGKTEEFNRRLREQPADTELWIQFIRYQDELSSAVFGGQEQQQGEASAESQKTSYRAILEKKLSIAERAVATNPTCIALQLERLRICQELWEPSALAKEWKKLVFLHPNSAPLWKRYLLFTQSYFSNFTVPRVISAYGKCLSTLSAVRDGSMVSHPALPGTEADMLDIFTQQCHFLRQAGHTEKAVSLFQAMIDFTFFKPDSVRNLSTKQQVDFFEPFWDSGEARVGEVGARGWKAWMVQQERGGWVQPAAEEEEEEDEDEEEVKDRSLPRGTVWLQVESSREAAHWLPWRPDKTKGQSEEDCEDPDRQVLFDDIGPSLICLSSPELQLRLLLHFFSFLGLPVDSVLSAAPCQPGMLMESLSLLTQGKEPQRPLTTFDLPEHGLHSVGHMTTLQGTRKWAGLGKQGEKFLSNVFNMILPVLVPQHRAILSLSWIQYEKLKVLRWLRCGNKKRLRSQGKSSKRVAKRLLKEPENRTSLIMWREYAHLEWMLGNQDEARKVFSTATVMGGSSLSRPSLGELSLLWAQLELEDSANQQTVPDADRSTSAAVAILTRLAEGSSSSPSPVCILKARRSFEQALSSSLSALGQNIQSQQDDRKAENEDVREDRFRLRGLVGCYALFQFLTVSIQAAITVYSQARDKMEALYLTLRRKGSEEEMSSEENQRFLSCLASDCEALAVQQAALLRHNNNINVFPLATLRQMLTDALSAWPATAPLWSIYIQVENRYHSAGRARRFFHAVTRDSSSVVPRLFAVVADQQRKQLVDAAQSLDGSMLVVPENGLSNRIRALFESAIATEMGAHCPLLWRMYIHFLVSDGKADKGRGIFYKALQSIPWAKGLYMDAVQLFPEHLQEFVDLMTEKELRLRLPLEELDILLED